MGKDPLGTQEHQKMPRGGGWHLNHLPDAKDEGCMKEAEREEKGEEIVRDGEQMGAGTHLNLPNQKCLRGCSRPQVPIHLQGANGKSNVGRLCARKGYD